MMKLIKKKCRWDFHKTYNYYWIENNDIVMKCDVTYYDGNPHEAYLNNVYVFEEYRNKGYFNILMDEMFSDIDGDEIIIVVRKEYWLIEKYKKLGFVYDGEYHDDKFEYYTKK